MLTKKNEEAMKNGHNMPTATDERQLYVPVGCGKCIECMQQKSRNWKIRLYEEIKACPSASFVTLTFAEESLCELKKQSNIDDDNDIATIAVRRFLERWRKRRKTSVKHWLITEKGHTNTKRIHLHGIIWSKDKNLIEETWKYGYVYIGQYVNQKTINYIAKYVTKIDTVNKDFTGKILCSAGLGKNYLNRPASTYNRFNGSETNEMYTNASGIRLPLPIYYRNKIYSEEERASLWTTKLDKNERFVLGKKVDMNQINSEEKYFKLLDLARNKNELLGYGKLSDWDKKLYRKILKNLKK